MIDKLDSFRISSQTLLKEYPVNGGTVVKPPPVYVQLLNTQGSIKPEKTPGSNG
jgi:hypothetical protein